MSMTGQDFSQFSVRLNEGASVYELVGPQANDAVIGKEVDVAYQGDGDLERVRAHTEVSPDYSSHGLASLRVHSAVKVQPHHLVAVEDADI